MSDDAHVMRLWRECGLPEYFLGNGETNNGLVALAARIRDEALEEAARLHENIDPACDHEREHGAPGAGAMGAVIRYRDAIRALPLTPKEPT